MSQKLAEDPCDSIEGNFDECSYISFQDMRHWRDTLPNPSWRFVDVVSVEDQIIEVHINVQDLNQGIVPVESGAGIYVDEGHFLDMKFELLGITAEQWEDWDVRILQYGSTHRIKIDESTETVEDLFSYGDFLLDWLTNENGNIVVDGQEIEIDIESGFDPEYEFGSELLAGGEVSVDNGDVQESQSGDGENTVAGAQNDAIAASSSGYLLIEGHNWEAKFAIMRVNYFFSQYVQSRITDFKRDGQSSERVCNWWIFGCRSVSLTAQMMRLENRYYRNTFGHLWRQGQRERTNVSSLSLGRNGAKIGGVCARGTVRDGSVTGSRIAESGTAFHRIDCNREFN